MEHSASAFDDSLMPKRPPDSAEFDITAMIDLVFMMNIYFLVLFIGKATGEIELPSAVHCAPLDPESATIITLKAGEDGQSVALYLGNETAGGGVRDAAEQDEQIHTAVEAGAAAGKKAVMIRAEKQVRLRELARISSSAAAAAEGITLHMAVMEKDTGP